MQTKDRLIKKVNYSPGITLRLIYSTEWEEYQIQWIENGEVIPEKTYFTDYMEDAIGTLNSMVNNRKEEN